MIKKESINPHYLVLDTNILRAKADEELISTKLTDFLNRYGIDFQIIPVIPDVVRDELLYQEWKKAVAELNTANSSFKKINTITRKNYSYRLTESVIKNRLSGDFKKWVENQKGLVLKAPVESIDFEDVIKRSVWRLPPFDKDPRKGEKGFRDAIILETLRHHLASCEHNNPVVFICHDILLRETAQKELQNYASLSIYESIEDFESYLKLTKQHLEDKFIRSIVLKATKKFYKAEDETALYQRDSIRDKIQNQYQQYFNDPSLSDTSDGALSKLFDPKGIFDPRGIRWEQQKVGLFWLYSAQFVESPSEKEYVWSTKVIFVKLYAPKQHPALPQRRFIGERLLKLTFSVKWKARITDSARFMKMELLSINLEGNEFKTPTADEKTDFKLNETSG